MKMRQAAIVALALMIIGVAGTAQAQQPQGTPRYEVAPRRAVRVQRTRQTRPPLFSRMMELERRKNAWLAQRFGLR
ncbi:hypothetical protein Mal4_54410 [Maioricimonas rarisocia]|uniref:Uncharacterized protein n=1 Tax=Maioricimonas rarisocia TaxID=2528026 RepID=A0A517ZF40_9PLAN|nr:hypothetical protein [Maioricimonas rarisocia]QDU41076.1 hypothetical protein Mal4_54410 [Maioricimonas rarisocia]